MTKVINLRIHSKKLSGKDSKKLEKNLKNIKITFLFFFVRKKMTNCGHLEREHYAKGMCSNCYHRYGRTKKPWLCTHDKLYACGLCQNCYINKYNQVKRQFKKRKREKLTFQYANSVIFLYFQRKRTEIDGTQSGDIELQPVEGETE